MRPRTRLFGGLMVVLLILGAAVLTWGVRTGRLTIFGDEPLIENADLVVTSDVDLAKGATAGDRQLTVTNGELELMGGARSGSAVFVVGQREVVAIHRLVPKLRTVSAAAARGLSFAFAGSVDGVSFSDYSPAQAVVMDLVDGVERLRPIELGFLIPEGSRFVRIKAVLTAGSNEPPTLAGFSLNYSQRSTLSADTTLLVNGSPTQEPATAGVPTPGRPENLVVTGPTRGILLLAGLALVSTAFWRIWLTDRKEGHGRGPHPSD